MSILDDSLNNFIDACNEAKENILVAYSACQNKGAILPDEKILANLYECINSIAGIIPSGTLNITQNGLQDVKLYEYINANISNLTQYASGHITINSNIAAVQTSYGSSKLKITVGFTPKIFIFRAPTYDAGRTLGKYSSSSSVIANSVNVYDGLTSGDMGTKFTTFISKTTFTSELLSTNVTVSGGDVTISAGNTGFNINPDNTKEVWWYITNASYAIRSGTWFWEAYA